MLGTVGVAPAGREVRSSSLVPDKFGGNMDTPEMKAGHHLLPRRQRRRRALLRRRRALPAGRGRELRHGRRGGHGRDLIVDLVKGGAPPEWPRIEHDDHYAVIGSSRPLEDAWRASQVGMAGWLGELYGLDRLDAYQLLTQISRSPLANVVDTNYSALTLVEKALLPAADAYSGMHRHLRELGKPAV